MVTLEELQAQVTDIDRRVKILEGGGTVTPPPTPTPTVFKDRFGTILKYKPVERGPFYEALWDNNTERTINAVRADTHDPIFVMRGNGSVYIDGEGVAEMSGSDPRFYFTKSDKSFAPFKNVESTCYFQRITDENLGYAGMVMGMRSQHHIRDSTNVNTMYFRVENDGVCSFYFEKDHSPQVTTTVVQKQVWPSIPKGVWIGYKFVMRDVPNAIQYEGYLDKANNGNFEQVLVYKDTNADRLARLRDKTGCVFVRNTRVTQWLYKKLSIYEIVP